MKSEKFKIFVTVVTIDDGFLSEVRTAIIEDFIVFDIKQRVDNDKFKVEGDFLYFEERLYIPKGPTRFRVLQFRYDFSAAGYFGFNKILEFIFRDFWWF
ncbi:hypothetical protein GCM10010252_78350 [Streptomyces aureoverticillatus]|nr:hypothetical protein GCM10010252_78350 [Streptomyces aureoverticillatus]